MFCFSRNLRNTRRWSTRWRWQRKVSGTSCLGVGCQSSWVWLVVLCCRSAGGWVWWNPVLPLHHRWTPRRVERRRWEMKPVGLLRRSCSVKTDPDLLVSPQIPAWWASPCTTSPMTPGWASSCTWRSSTWWTGAEVKTRLFWSCWFWTCWSSKVVLVCLQVWVSDQGSCGTSVM